MDRIVWRRDASSTQTVEIGSLGWTYSLDDGRLDGMTIEPGGGGDSFTFHMDYDDDDMLMSVQDSNGDPVFDLSRDEYLGRLTGTALRAGPGGDVRATDTLAYSAFGELAEYRAFSDGLNLLRLQYQRDNAGRITRKVETALSDSPLGVDTDALRVNGVIRLRPRLSPPVFSEKTPPCDRVGVIYYDLTRNCPRISLAAPRKGLTRADWKEAEIVWVDLKFNLKNFNPKTDVKGARPGKPSLANASKEEVLAAMERAKARAKNGTSIFLKSHAELEAMQAAQAAKSGQ